MAEALAREMVEPQTAQPLLDIRNLRIEARVYPPGEEPRDVTIVDDVSLTLQRGKVLGLIGESGAGKSTIGLSSMGYGRGGVRITGGDLATVAVRGPSRGSGCGPGNAPKARALAVPSAGWSAAPGGSGVVAQGP